MNSNGIILSQSWWEGVTITASSEALAVENAQNTQPSEPWRSVGSGTHTWTWDFGQPRYCDTICLWNTSLGLDDTVTLELASDASITQDVVTYEWPGRYCMLGWGEQPWDVGPVAEADESNVYKAPFVVETFTAVFRRYGRLTFERTSGYTEVGAAMIGQGRQPSINMSWGLDFGWQNPSDVSRTRGGQARSLTRPKFRRGTANFQWAEQLDAKMLDDIIYDASKTRVVLFIPYPAVRTTLNRRYTVLARIGEASGPAHSQLNTYTLSLPFTEAL